MSLSRWRKSLLLAVIAYEATGSLAFQPQHLRGAGANHRRPLASSRQRHAAGPGALAAADGDGIAEPALAQPPAEGAGAEGGSGQRQRAVAGAVGAKNGRPSPSGACYYRRPNDEPKGAGPPASSSSWRPRKELRNVGIGERLFATRLPERDLLDGRSGPKVFLDCGVGKINSRGGRDATSWSVVNGMVRIGRKGMKASVVRKKLKKMPPGALVEVYASRVRAEEGTLEVCLGRDEALERGAARRSSASSLEEGRVLAGTVRDVAPYGVFVDVNANRNGLLHISRVARRQGKFVNREEGLRALGLGRGQPVDVIVVSNGKKRLELDLAPPREEAPEEEEDGDAEDDDDVGSGYEELSGDEAAAWAAYGAADEGGSAGDAGAGSDVDDEAAMWAAYAAPDYSPDDDDDDNDDDVDEDRDIEDSMGIGGW